MGKGSKTQTQTQSTQVNIPDYLEGPLKDVISRIEELSGEGFTAYGQERVAGLSQDELDAFQGIRGQVGDTAGAYGQATTAASDILARLSGGISGDDIESRVNPFFQNVVDIERRKAIEEGDRQRLSAQDQAARSGVFGGSRSGIIESQLEGNLQERLGDIQAIGSRDAYDNAVNQFFREQSAGLGAAGALASLAGAQQQGALTDYASLENIGRTQRGIEQQGLDFDYEEFLRQEADPYQKSSFLLNSIGSVLPGVSGQTTTGVTTKPKQSIWSTVLGLAGTAAGAFLGGPGGASLGASLGSSLGGGGGFGGLSDLFGGGGGGTQQGGWAPGNSFGFREGGLVSLPQNSIVEGEDLTPWSSWGGLLGGSVGPFKMGGYTREEEEEIRRRAAIQRGESSGPNLLQVISEGIQNLTAEGERQEQNILSTLGSFFGGGGDEDTPQNPLEAVVAEASGVPSQQQQVPTPLPRPQRGTPQAIEIEEVLTAEGEDRGFFESLGQTAGDFWERLTDDEYDETLVRFGLNLATAGTGDFGEDLGIAAKRTFDEFQALDAGAAEAALREREIRVKERTVDASIASSQRTVESKLANLEAERQKNILNRASRFVETVVEGRANLGEELDNQEVQQLYYQAIERELAADAALRSGRRPQASSSGAIALTPEDIAQFASE